MTEAVQPIDAGRGWREKEAPPNCLGIGCSEGVSAKKPPVRRRILDFFFFFLLVFRHCLRLVSSSGRVFLRLNVSFQCHQLESRLHQMAVVVPEFLLGPPVPYLVKSSFGKISYGVLLLLC